jgi:hypothetical protein
VARQETHFGGRFHAGAATVRIVVLRVDSQAQRVPHGRHLPCTPEKEAKPGV